MDELFLFKLVLSSVVGGAWTALVITIAEKFGTKTGGIITGLPATVAISLFFIGWTQTPAFAARATTIMPLVMGIDALFVVVYVWLYRFNFLLALTGALIFWFLMSLGSIFLGFNNFGYALAVCAIFLAFTYFILEKKIGIKSESRKIVHYTGRRILLRGGLSGAVIASAVLMAEIWGELLGGAFAAFPAVIVALIIIAHFAQGRSFSCAILKVAIFTGEVNVVVYVTTVRYSYLQFGLVYGTLIAVLVSLVSASCLYFYVSKKIA